MPELRVVAVSNDGTRLVLKAADSTEYTLPIDERLRAAVRGDRPRLGQIEIEVESHLRPRDIQARIRAGASAEASSMGAAGSRISRHCPIDTLLLGRTDHVAVAVTGP